MKRRIIAAVFTGMLTVALFPAIAHAEIELSLIHIYCEPKGGYKSVAFAALDNICLLYTARCV